MAFDPYEILGVAKDADDETIKRAYRAKSKTAHPDGGGSTEEFQRVHMAYLVLSDPVKRGKFDRDGSVDAEHVSNLLAAQVGIIMAFLMQNISAIEAHGQDPVSVDLFKHVRNDIARTMGKLGTDKSNAQEKIKKLRRIADHIKSKPGKKNMIQQALLHQCSQGEAMVAQLENQIEANKAALILLDDHDFDVIQQLTTISGFTNQSSGAFGMWRDLPFT